MYEVLCVTKAMFSLYFILLLSFFGHPLCGRRCCHCHFNLASPSGEWVRVPKVTSKCSSVSISTVIAPQSQHLSGQWCSSNMRKRAVLSCGTVEFHFLTWACLAARICKQGKERLRKVSEVKWPQWTQHEARGWCLCLQNRSQWLTIP